MPRPGKVGTASFASLLFALGEEHARLRAKADELECEVRSLRQGEVSPGGGGQGAAICSAATDDGSSLCARAPIAEITVDAGAGPISSEVLPSWADAADAAPRLTEEKPASKPHIVVGKDVSSLETPNGLACSHDSARGTVGSFPGNGVGSFPVGIESETLGDLYDGSGTFGEPLGNSRKMPSSAGGLTDSSSPKAARKAGSSTDWRSKIHHSNFADGLLQEINKRVHRSERQAKTLDDDDVNFLRRVQESPATAVQQLVHSTLFESVCGIVVLASVFFVGMETNHLATHTGLSNRVHEVAQYFFYIFFFLELAMRVIADGAIFFCGPGWRWNWLDAFCVCSSLLDMILAIVAPGISVGSLLRTLRLLLLLRALRLFRTLKAVHEFRKMLYAILSSMRTLTCALVILFFVMYFFAIIMCHGVTEFRLKHDGEDLSVLEALYGSLPATLYTLFAAVSNGTSWQAVVSPLRSLHVVYSAGLLFYIALVIFGVANVVTSVFVESAVMSAQDHRELIVYEKQHAKEVALKHIMEVFHQMDVDGSGEISHQEMDYVLTDPALMSYIDALGINAENTRMLFCLLDTDNSGKVDMSEFQEGCLRMSGDAKGIDVHILTYHVKQFLTKWPTFTDRVELSLQNLCGDSGVQAYHQSDVKSPSAASGFGGGDGDDRCTVTSMPPQSEPEA